MPRRQLKEKNIRKLTKVGRGSLAVTIPVEMRTQLGWREKQKVIVKKSGRKIIIEDWKK
jgi:bifunctional DNA-binding transcriptional regulator/antitoxin component of YhaV-PrlF toxin-antitoxin module